MHRPATKVIAAICTFGIAIQPAHAHLVGAEFGDFYAGALHVLSAPEHVVAILGLALLAAFHSRETSRWILLGAPVGLVAGMTLAAFAPRELSLEIGLALTLIFAGILGVVAQPLPAVALAVIGALITMILGIVNAVSGRVAEVDWLLYGGGVIASIAVLLVLLVAMMTKLADTAEWIKTAARALSSWITAIGLIFFAVSLNA